MRNGVPRLTLEKPPLPRSFIMMKSLRDGDFCCIENCGCAMRCLIIHRTHTKISEDSF